MVTIAPYGTWTSPINAADVAELGGGPQWADLRDGRAWWAQARPAEGGRVALCRAEPDGTTREVLGAPWNVRNRVHEYGGRPWALVGTGADTRLVFTHWDDQRVYVVDPDGAGEPVPLSPLADRHHGHRYAEPTGSADGTEVWCVRETVTGDRPTDVRRDLVALPLSGAAATDAGAARVLIASHQFLSGPKVSPDGKRVAWLGWNHPLMPWDGTDLYIADLVEQEGHVRFAERSHVTGGPDESVCQFEWEDPDTLLAINDPDGWWNLYRIDLDPDCATDRNLAPVDDELGGPLWKLGARWFARLGAGRYAVLRHGALAILDVASGTVTDVPVSLPVWSAELAAEGDVIVGIACAADRDDAVVRLDLATGELTELTGQPAALPDPAYLPTPAARTFRDDRGRHIPAYVYPPTNPDFAGPPGEAPPLLVHVHGGPTGAAGPGFAPSLAYFTSRGFAVVAVNYGGSTGYGREFRERLRGQWGVVDVADCAAVATALAKEGSADPARLVVRGGSAGGWTAAASLTATSVYRCGTVMYPILDLIGWTAAGGQTHDFESRYVEGLVGRLVEHPDRFVDRSPINNIDKLFGPVLMLQGLEDKICPPVQADRFMAALTGSGIPHAYLRFPGEQHGFRRAETIRAALEAELSFYGQVFGFTTPGVPVLDLRA